MLHRLDTRKFCNLLGGLLILIEISNGAVVPMNKPGNGRPKPISNGQSGAIISNLHSQNNPNNFPPPQHLSHQPTPLSAPSAPIHPHSSPPMVPQIPPPVTSASASQVSNSNPLPSSSSSAALTFGLHHPRPPHNHGSSVGNSQQTVTYSAHSGGSNPVVVVVHQAVNESLGPDATLDTISQGVNQILDYLPTNGPSSPSTTIGEPQPQPSKPEQLSMTAYPGTIAHNAQASLAPPSNLPPVASQQSAPSSTTTAQQDILADADEDHPPFNLDAYLAQANLYFSSQPPSVPATPTSNINLISEPAKPTTTEGQIQSIPSPQTSSPIDNSLLHTPQLAPSHAPVSFSMAGSSAASTGDTITIVTTAGNLGSDSVHIISPTNEPPLSLQTQTSFAGATPPQQPQTPAIITQTVPQPLPQTVIEDTPPVLTTPSGPAAPSGPVAPSGPATPTGPATPSVPPTEAVSISTSISTEGSASASTGYQIQIQVTPGSQIAQTVLQQQQQQPQVPPVSSNSNQQQISQEAALMQPPQASIPTEQAVPQNEVNMQPLVMPIHPAAQPESQTSTFESQQPQIVNSSSVDANAPPAQPPLLISNEIENSSDFSSSTDSSPESYEPEIANPVSIPHNVAIIPDPFNPFVSSEHPSNVIFEATITNSNNWNANVGIPNPEAGSGALGEENDGAPSYIFFPLNIPPNVEGTLTISAVPLDNPTGENGNSNSVEVSIPIGVASSASTEEGIAHIPVADDDDDDYPPFDVEQYLAQAALYLGSPLYNHYNPQQQLAAEATEVEDIHQEHFEHPDTGISPFHSSVELYNGETDSVIQVIAPPTFSHQGSSLENNGENAGNGGEETPAHLELIPPPGVLSFGDDGSGHVSDIVVSQIQPAIQQQVESQPQVEQPLHISFNPSGASQLPIVIAAPIPQTTQIEIVPEHENHPQQITVPQEQHRPIQNGPEAVVVNNISPHQQSGVESHSAPIPVTNDHLSSLQDPNPGGHGDELSLLNSSALETLAAESDDYAFIPSGNFQNFVPQRQKENGNVENIHWSFYPPADFPLNTIKTNPDNFQHISDIDQPKERSRPVRPLGLIGRPSTLGIAPMHSYSGGKLNNHIGGIPLTEDHKFSTETLSGSSSKNQNNGSSVFHDDNNPQNGMMSVMGNTIFNSHVSGDQPTLAVPANAASFIMAQGQKLPFHLSPSFESFLSTPQSTFMNNNLSNNLNNGIVAAVPSADETIYSATTTGESNSSSAPIKPPHYNYYFPQDSVKNATVLIQNGMMRPLISPVYLVVNTNKDKQDYQSAENTNDMKNIPDESHVHSRNNLTYLSISSESSFVNGVGKEQHNISGNVHLGKRATNKEDSIVGSSNFEEATKEDMLITDNNSNSSVAPMSLEILAEPSNNLEVVVLPPPNMDSSPDSVKDKIAEALKTEGDLNNLNFIHNKFTHQKLAESENDNEMDVVDDDEGEEDEEELEQLEDEDDDEEVNKTATEPEASSAPIYQEQPNPATPQNKPLPNNANKETTPGNSISPVDEQHGKKPNQPIDPTFNNKTEKQTSTQPPLPIIPMPPTPPNFPFPKFPEMLSSLGGPGGIMIPENVGKHPASGQSTSKIRKPTPPRHLNGNTFKSKSGPTPIEVHNKEPSNNVPPQPSLPTQQQYPHAQAAQFIPQPAVMPQHLEYGYVAQYGDGESDEDTEENVYDSQIYEHLIPGPQSVEKGLPGQYHGNGRPSVVPSLAAFSAPYTNPAAYAPTASTGSNSNSGSSDNVRDPFTNYYGNQACTCNNNKNPSINNSYEPSNWPISDINNPNVNSVSISNNGKNKPKPAPPSLASTQLVEEVHGSGKNTTRPKKPKPTNPKKKPAKPKPPPYALDAATYYAHKHGNKQNADKLKDTGEREEQPILDHGHEHVKLVTVVSSASNNLHNHVSSKKVVEEESPAQEEEILTEENGGESESEEEEQAEDEQQKKPSTPIKVTFVTGNKDDSRPIGGFGGPIKVTFVTSNKDKSKPGEPVKVTFVSTLTSDMKNHSRESEAIPMPLQIKVVASNATKNNNESLSTSKDVPENNEPAPEPEPAPVKQPAPLMTSISWFGWEIPIVNWNYFTDLFTGIFGRNFRTISGEFICGDTDDDSLLALRSELDVDYLCGVDGDLSRADEQVDSNLCNMFCAENGFYSGMCIPQKSCLCYMTEDKNFAIKLDRLQDTNSSNPTEMKHSVETNMHSVASNSSLIEDGSESSCQTCRCLRSCQSRGKYVGYCSKSCHCGVPWYNKQLDESLQPT